MSVSHAKSVTIGDFTGTVTVFGSTGGTTGTLINAGLFSQGDRAVVDNDVIQVSGTWSM